MCWWQFGRATPALDAAVAMCEHVLVTPCISNTLGFARLHPPKVFSHKLNVFPLPRAENLPLVQSRVHEFWARTFASSMKDDVNYSPTDCFETFPFPTVLLDSAANDPSHEATCLSLGAIGERYHQFRSELMR
jgi:hypothetical protein